MTHSSVRSSTANTGKTVLALVAILSLLLSLFAIARPVIATEPPGGGNADCPEGTVFLDNFPAGELVVGLELAPGVTITARTPATGDPTSVTVTNTTDENITIAVKGGSDQVGNSVTIGPNDSETISVTNNPTISNLSVCEGPEIPESPTLTVAKVTVGGDSDFQFTLDTVNAALLSNGESQEIATAAGEYDIAEVLSAAQVTAGWSVTGIECEGNAAAETAVVADGTVTVTVGADEDVLCTFTNTLTPPPPPDGELEVDKFNCVGEDDDTVFFVFGPLSSLTEPDTSECTIGAGVTFSVYTDAGGGVPGDFVLEDTTDAEGIIEVPLPAGDYVLVEGAEGEEGPSQAFTITSGAITAIVVLNIEGDDDEGEVKILKFVCPGEEDSVVFYQEGDPTIPNLEDCEVGEATFTIDDGEEFTTVNGGALETVAADVEHTLAEIEPNQGSTTFTVADGDRVTIIVINFEGEDENPGSVTINKEVACEICETFTPGFFFNRGENNAGTAFTNDWLPDNQVTIAGETFGDLEFDGTSYDSAVQEVNAYLEADRSGDLDGQTGLSAQGQLVRQSLALYLNVGLAGDECVLAELVYTGDVVLPDWVDADENGEITVQELLDAALAATDEAEMRAIAEAIDEINNSGDGDNPDVLDCPEGAEGTTGAGFMFELYGPDDDTVLADSGTTNENGVLVLDGNPDGTGLPLGEYLLVETDNDPNLECSIVDVTGVPENAVTLNEDGTVTIVLTEQAPDVTITVVNECEQGEEEEEFGAVEIRKDADDDTDEPFGFSATWDADGFMLTGGGAPVLSGDLEAGAMVTVTETLTEAQVQAGWSFEGIDCGTATVTIVGSSVTVTVVANETIICTFTNELDREDEEPGGGGPGSGETPREGTQGGNPVPDTALSPIPTGSLPAALLALLMLAGLGTAGYAVRAEARRRR